MGMLRMAGQILATGGLGALGAVGADALAHDDMDRAAQSYKDLGSSMSAADEMTQRVFAGVFAQGEMSIKDRMLAAGILSGELPPAAAEEAKKFADTPAGKKGIALAGEVMMKRPELGPPAAELANQEIALFAKEQRMGVSPGDVISAADQGAGVSMVPAVLGGTALGSVGAGVAALANRRRA